MLLLSGQLLSRSLALSLALSLLRPLLPLQLKECRDAC
jgi:hypothetical protein